MSTTYTFGRHEVIQSGNTFICNCTQFTNRRNTALDARSCKHIIRVRGKEQEMQRMAWKHEDKNENTEAPQEGIKEEGKKAARKTEKRKRKEQDEANKVRRRRNEDIETVEPEVEEDKGEIEHHKGEVEQSITKTQRYKPKTNAAVFQAAGADKTNEATNNHRPNQSSLQAENSGKTHAMTYEEYKGSKSEKLRIRDEKRKLLTAKTCRGQPVLGNHISLLLQKIQSSM